MAIGLVALLLAAAAFALATIANRRHMRRGPRRAATEPASLARDPELASQVAALAGQVAQLSEQVAALPELAAHTTALSEQLSQLSTDIPRLEAEFAAVPPMAAELAEVTQRVSDLGDKDSEHRRLVTTATSAAATALRRVAIVRYDAFSDLGGRLSYSTAILDDTGSGLVITALSGKSDVRTYIKAISAGSGESPLTPEEDQAVAAAMSEAVEMSEGTDR